MSSEVLIVGLGSSHGDDQAGWRVIERLHARGVSTGRARVAKTPTELCDWCRSDYRLTVCDASSGPGRPGMVRSWIWPDHALPVMRSGTHDLPLGEVLELGKNLGCIPPQVRIWTVSGIQFEAGAEPSEQVLIAAHALADHLFGGLVDA
jgi:hydrogenase maturation protease